MTGSRPVVDFMFGDFIMDAIGELVNQIAKMQYMSSGRLKMPILLRGCIGIGHSAATHHSGNYYPLYAHFPGFRVVVPSNAYDAKGLMIEAIRDDNPVMYFFHKGIMGLPWMAYFTGSTTQVPEEPYTVPFGQAKVVREGTDVTVVTLSQMVHKSMAAAEALAQDGISVEVIDLRTLVPLDKQTVLNSVRKTGRLCVADEDYLSFGLSGEIAAIVAENLDTVELTGPVKRLAVPDVPIPYSRPLEQAAIPQVTHIESSVRGMLN